MAKTPLVAHRVVVDRLVSEKPFRVAKWSRLAGLIVGVSLLSVAGGCRSGSSWSKPSTWAFGGGGATEESLASAPAFDGAVQKPSETSTPYPTTTTPEGYVLTGSEGVGDAVAAVEPSRQPTPITYGQTNPAPAQPMTSPAPALAADAGSPARPQVGPYQSLSPASNSVAAGPFPQTARGEAGSSGAESGFGGITESAPAAAASAGSRYAALAPPAQQQIAPPGPPVGAVEAAAAVSAPIGSRYGAEMSSSRYGTASSQAFVPTETPAIAPAAMPAEVIAPPPGRYLEAPPTPMQTPANPGRPADHGYRPGGTSSYRPAEAIFAEGNTKPQAALGGLILPDEQPIDGVQRTSFDRAPGVLR
jgi:hypothetical protein